MKCSLSFYASLAAALPMLVSTACGGRVDDSGATPTTPDADCAPFNVIYAEPLHPAPASAPLDCLMAVGDAVYYEMVGTSGVALDKLVEGQAPVAVLSGMHDIVTRPWTDGQSFFWVGSQGLMHVPVDGNVPVLDAPSPLIGRTRVVAHDETTFYGFLSSPPSLVTQPLYGATPDAIKTLATLPTWPDGEISLYDAGDRIVVLNAGQNPDGSLGSYDIALVSKSDGTVTSVPQPTDSYAFVDLDATGGLLANTRSYGLSSFTFAGSETVLYPSGGVQGFAVAKAAHGADGTVYLSGQILQQDGWRQPAFASVPLGGTMSFLQCGTRVLETDTSFAAQPTVMAVGASAVYGMVLGDGAFQIVKIPK